ncbi:glycerol-3-phosphate acyltransferase 4-like [Oppia nitens]|uniref:glycerol-3-phosphate acyltransferase 4-like n=1 Tax=Oppia nitens TaxID=1686743 RepID=UPI0023DA4184|nr:glycerol-3-phosphate acyltransferase 4-like [Oppia nitens]
MIFIALFTLAIIIWLGLASVGHDFYIHQRYVEKLLQLFEYGRKRADIVEVKIKERQRKISRLQIQSYEPESDDNDEDKELEVSNDKSRDGINNEEEDDLFDPFHVHKSANVGNNIGNIFDNRRHRTMSLSINQEKKEFNLADIYEFVRTGVKAMVDDEVTKRFAAKELPTWNLLTRTDKFYHYNSLRLALIWWSGLLFRYLFLFPLRFTITFLGVSWLVFCTGLIAQIPNGRLKRWVYYRVSIMCFRVLSRGFSGLITYHDVENRAKSGGICVANHTSPIDVVILHCDNSYALVGQTHGGFLGILQRALARATHHIWFDRSEMTDRLAVSHRLQEHVQDTSKLPILIFPEGTCINNSAVMMFKKGAFEVGGTIYPVAIKYDARFGDPFWNSSKYGYVKYLLMMMTSWAIVCDVWYLPSMTRSPDESSTDFAQRVKAQIALKGGLVDLEIDGQLKRQNVKPEWKARQQLHYSRRISVGIGPYSNTNNTNNIVNNSNLHNNNITVDNRISG